MLLVKGLCYNCWLINLAVDVYIYNNQFLIMEDYNKPIKIGRSILNRSLLGRKKIQLQLSLKDSSKSFILNLQNVYYLLSSQCNLVSLKLLNNSKIFYYNKNKILYQLESKKILAQAKQ